MTWGAAIVAGGCVLASCVLATSGPIVSVAVAAQEAIYRPALKAPETLAPFLEHLEPGSDEFALERDATALETPLRELAELFRSGRPGNVGARLLAPDFRGGRLVDAEAAATVAATPLTVVRSAAAPERPLDSRAFATELQRLLADVTTITVAELLITAIEAPSSAGVVRTRVRYDLVGTGARAWRVEHVGVWAMGWRRTDGGWRIVEWSRESHVVSRAAQPLFAEVTQAALGGNESFTRQLTTDLDSWMARIDSVLTRDSNGHHGVSAGDADGDGLDDLYVAQPAGLPNRLYRARGDGTFEDITERAGVGVLDDTAQSLFVDVDNDGDEDLVLSTPTHPLLFVNAGGGRFAPAPDAFRFDQPPQGVLTSMAMADYDRDGFLDLYLCVYSYLFGAGEDKAGTPAPYYDARNGPPGVLLRNDGHGRFVDVTRAAGLDAGNDRYHFAAAWADYDHDGWPDLLVANDFGTKNLYRNRGARSRAAGGAVTFEDVAATAGLLDHGAGMSAAFLDYDNDGRLDIYTGNIWSANGQRVTAAPSFMPDAPADVRALYRRHARGNSLFRNRGDGSFDDTTVAAGAGMGRWAWSSDSLDFDSDGWDDLYVANGMLTRASGPRDLDGFFWRQVVARSPLTRVKGTTYDEAWRAMNHLLVHDSIASHQRNVLLRNDGRGGFDEVSGSVGLDLDQDGRSFAVLDLDRDGDPDLAVMAARQAPQLRLFRNDYAPRGAAIALRLTAVAGNRDAIGARVIVETDRFTRTRIVQAGSGFLSQHSKELLIGLGASRTIRSLTIEWPSGSRQVWRDTPLNMRWRVVEGREPEREPFAPTNGTATSTTPSGTAGRAVAPPDAVWLYEPVPAPELSAPDLRGPTRSLTALRGAPALLLLWASDASGSRAALAAMATGREALARAGIGTLALAVDPPAAAGAVRAMAPTGLPAAHATPEQALGFALLHRHVFMNRLDLRLPTALLLDSAGRVVRLYRGPLDVALIVRDAAAIDATPDARLARALPFAGTLYSPPPMRNYLPYGRELLDQGLDAAALVAFDRAAQANPSASTLYRLGTLLTRSGDTTRARAAFERALALQPDLAEASNDLGALLAQGADIEGAIARFRAALAATPDYPDALNNLGYALLLTGHEAEARPLYEKALALQPDFPEALNNLGLLLGRAGDLDGAERYFRDALKRRADYGDAANNLALVLVARGQTDAAVRLLETFLQTSPQFEDAYVTLAKIHFNGRRTAEGIAALERLLQRNPTHPLGLELLRQMKPR
jgi:Flp pilus assembly protein TadD